jgi:energy-coupling factor transporter ATP-binding protein EcfA2
MRENIYIDANTPRKEFPKLPSLVSLVSQNITVPIKSTRFKGWLAYEFLQETKETIGIQTLSSVCLVLEAETMSKPACTLYNRFAPDGRGGFYWDMADDDGRAIHVTPRGWMVKPAPLKMFRKFPHMMALPEPKQGGTLEAFLKYLNVYAANDKLLAVVAVISNLIPEVPRVGTVVTGVQGSGKSTWHRLMQNLLDPSSTDLLTMPSPQKDEDLSQILEHHAVALFDNVNTITRTQSDLLCRAITGAGYEKRELYTTDDSFIRRYIRIVGLNSISMPVEKGDLFSRVILLPWEQITDRKTDAEMQAMIQADVPGLMYCILNILVDAMKRHPSTSTSLNVRMSDFAKWGCAITEAIGLRKAVFEKAYRDNVRAQDEEAVRASLLAEMIIRYFTRNPNQLNIEGSSTDIKKLLEDFENPLDERGRPTGDLLSRREGWAKNTTRFGRDLTEVAHHLTNIGYKVVTPKTGGRGKTRNYIIERFAGVGGVERGQRRFDTVDPDELTETRLRDVLRVAGLTRISPDVSDVSDVSDVTNVSDVTPTPDANDANNANRDADTKDIKDVIDTNDANDTKISAPVGEGLYEKVLKDLSEMNWDEAVKDETLFEAIEEKHGVKRGATVKVVSTMVREGTLFMPRPGYYKFSGGSK